MSYSKADRAFNSLKAEYLDVYSEFLISPSDVSKEDIEKLERLVTFWLQLTNRPYILSTIDYTASFIGQVGYLIEEEEAVQRAKEEQAKGNMFQRAWRAWMRSLVLIQTPIIVFTILGLAVGVILGQIHALNFVNNDLIQNGIKGFHYSKF